MSARARSRFFGENRDKLASGEMGSAVKKLCGARKWHPAMYFSVNAHSLLPGKLGRESINIFDGMKKKN
jgi:hypothetical protein